MDTVVADAPALTENMRADTVVIGSGIAGLSTAYELGVPGPEGRRCSTVAGLPAA